MKDLGRIKTQLVWLELSRFIRKCSLPKLLKARKQNKWKQDKWDKMALTLPNISAKKPKPRANRIGFNTTLVVKTN
ncbi:MAG: hypothetical protein ACKESC_00920 [Candidatus Hodgkinia cicadicola]